MFGPQSQLKKAWKLKEKYFENWRLFLIARNLSSFFFYVFFWFIDIIRNICYSIKFFLWFSSLYISNVIRFASVYCNNINFLSTIPNRSLIHRVCLQSDWAPRRVDDWPCYGSKRKCFSQEHNDSLPTSGIELTEESTFFFCNFFSRIYSVINFFFDVNAYADNIFCRWRWRRQFISMTRTLLLNETQKIKSIYQQNIKKILRDHELIFLRLIHCSTSSCSKQALFQSQG